MGQRFSYVKYDQASIDAQNALREHFEALETLVEILFTANSRPKSLMLTALEEAYMWSGKAIRDAQIKRTGVIDEQPERKTD